MTETDWDNMVWDEEVGDFVSANSSEKSERKSESKDSNGNILVTGDSVILTRDLDVKGCPIKLKRGTKVKIRQSDTPDLVECKIGKTGIFLKTEFLKKV